MEAMFGLIAKLLVAPIGKQLGYLTFYKKNVKQLKDEVLKLNRIRDDLQPIRNDAESSGQIIIQAVLDWHAQVDNAKAEAQTFNRHCWNTSRYSLSRKAKKMTQDVIELQQEGKKFTSGNIANFPSPGWPQHLTTTTGESSMGGESNAISLIVDDVLETFKDDQVYMIGIHGLNHDDMNRLVTTLFIKAENQFEHGVIADAVEYDRKKIQDEVAFWLGMTKFVSNNEAERRHRLSTRLRDPRKKLILFKDVCEGLNLEAIGIPIEQNTSCKIIMTSSNKSICERMNTQKNYKLQVHKQMLLVGGHSTGELWDDKAHTTIRSIIVAYNETGICSFQTEYDDNGHWSRSPTHNFLCRSTHENEEKIELKHPDEFLISVSGYYLSESNHVVLHSLKFESNKQSFGPFGPETGQPFTSAPEAGKIIGFYGRYSPDFLDSFGYYYEPISSPTAPSISGFGGPGGWQFDDGPYSTIRRIEIGFSNVIKSIRVEYDLNGRSSWKDRHGATSSENLRTIQLDYPGEFVISISVWRGTSSEGWIVLASLTIETNRSVYGPFGAERGERFKFPPNHSGKIIGFHGKTGGYVDSLGAYIEPFPAQNPTTLFAQVGGIDGTPWDDGAAHSTIRQIILKVSNVIVQIETEYDKNGRADWSPRHQIACEHSEEVIKLDYPGEFLISMSGTTRVYESRQVVSSLKFQSNRKTYGPYGNHSGDPFSTSPSTSGKIVGFHGQSGAHLESVGAHFEPFSNS